MSASVAVKRVNAWQVAEAMKAAKLSKADLAKRMNTSRSQLDRVLDEADTGLTLDTLSRAAAVLGYRIRADLVPPKQRHSKGRKGTAEPVVRAT